MGLRFTNTYGYGCAGYENIELYLSYLADCPQLPKGPLLPLPFTQDPALLDLLNILSFQG